MRVLLLTGPDAVAVSEAAAATGVAAAAAGRKTCVLGLDPSGPLGDVLAAALRGPLGPEPVELGDPHAGCAAAVAPAPDLAAAPPFPGAEDAGPLLAVREIARSDRYDVLVVDAGPLPAALRVLRMPEAVAAWAADASRGAAAEALADDLADTRALLTAASSSVRLVAAPGPGAAAARRAATALALHGYRREPDGAAAGGPPGEPVVAEPVRVARTADGYALTVTLPGEPPTELALGRRGDDLLVRAGAERRALRLPAVLRRCSVTDASVDSGVLTVAFTPDAALWRPREG